MKIQVKSVEGFSEFLSSIIKVVPGCKFMITSGGCKVAAINDNKTVRAFFATDAVSATEDCDFSFVELSTLLKAVKLLNDVSEMKDCELDFDGSFLSHSGRIKFKLKVSKAEAVERFITQELKTDLVPAFSFSTSSENIKRVASQLAVAQEDSSRVYFSLNGDEIMAEMDDKTNAMANSIGLPLSDKCDSGDFKVTAISYANFKLFGVLDGDVKITYTGASVFDVKSACMIGEKENAAKIGMRLICASVKG